MWHRKTIASEALGVKSKTRLGKYNRGRERFGL